MNNPQTTLVPYYHPSQSREYLCILVCLVAKTVGRNHMKNHEKTRVSRVSVGD